MARPTIVRPPTDLIVGPDGKLTPEYSRKFDELFGLMADLQNPVVDGGDGGGGAVTPGLSEEEVQALIDTAIDEYAATQPTITTYSQDFTMSPDAFATITHNLGVVSPLWSVTLESNTSAPIFILDEGNENESYLNWNTTVAISGTITLYRIDFPT